VNNPPALERHNHLGKHTHLSPRPIRWFSKPRLLIKRAPPFWSQPLAGTIRFDPHFCIRSWVVYEKHSGHDAAAAAAAAATAATAISHHCVEENSVVGRHITRVDWLFFCFFFPFSIFQTNIFIDHRVSQNSNQTQHHSNQKSEFECDNIRNPGPAITSIPPRRCFTTSFIPIIPCTVFGQIVAFWFVFYRLTFVQCSPPPRNQIPSPWTGQRRILTPLLFLLFCFFSSASNSGHR